jgi:hypothetical protein
VAVGSGDSVAAAVGDSVSETCAAGSPGSDTATPVPVTTSAPAAITVAASLFPERVKKDMRPSVGTDFVDSFQLCGFPPALSESKVGPQKLRVRQKTFDSA